MMAKKLASLLALLGFTVVLATWLIFKWSGRPVMEVERVVTTLIVVMICFFFWGVFVARIGISLIQEVIADRRGEEEARRNRARMRYEQAIGTGGELPPEGMETH